MGSTAPLWMFAAEAMIFWWVVFSDLLLIRPVPAYSAHGGLVPYAQVGLHLRSSIPQGVTMENRIRSAGVFSFPLSGLHLGP